MSTRTVRGSAPLHLIEHSVSMRAATPPDIPAISDNGARAEVTSVAVLIAQTGEDPPRAIVRVFGWPLEADGTRSRRTASPRQIFVTPDGGPVLAAAQDALTAALTVGGWTRAQVRGVPGWLH